MSPASTPWLVMGLYSAGQRVDSSTIHVRRGIQQGRRTVGLLGALVLDLLARKPPIVAEHTFRLLSHVFADDLSSGMRDTVCGLQLLLPALRSLDQAAGLRLNLRKTNVINYSRAPDGQSDTQGRIANGGRRRRAARCLLLEGRPWVCRFKVGRCARQEQGSHSAYSLPCTCEFGYGHTGGLHFPSYASRAVDIALDRVATDGGGCPQ